MRAIETESGNTYYHNGDFSGDVSWEFFDGGHPVGVSIPFADVLELAAAYVRSRRIEVIENASPDEILGS